MGQKFTTGRVVTTSGIARLRSVREFDRFLADSLARHQRGDWGDTDPEDEGLNDQALLEGSRLFSVYNLPGEFEIIEAPDDQIWIITEWDRSYTRILWPSEY